jgi:hypothetical protein
MFAEASSVRVLGERRSSRLGIGAKKGDAPTAGTRERKKNNRDV